MRPLHPVSTRNVVLAHPMPQFSCCKWRCPVFSYKSTSSRCRHTRGAMIVPLMLVEEVYLFPYATTTRRWLHHCALILCPNIDLCDQVVTVATSLTLPGSRPLCTARVVSSRTPPPLRTPLDLVVSTPAALLRFLEEAGRSYGPEWEAQSFAQRVRHVVADEADALITSDSFWKPLEEILNVRGLNGCDCASLQWETCLLATSLDSEAL
jgi:hypothetical protein